MSTFKTATAAAAAAPSFMRGIESDLRALCADARRRNPSVKAAAEKVILLLKEADGDEALFAATDAAASAFCAACELPNHSASAANAQTQTKITVRAVSCLHKLLTHRAISAAVLPEILNTIDELGTASVDDAITLKVVQANLSLLTAREYTHALSEDQLARAFSLFFKLKTNRAATSVSTASNALSAISNIGSGREDGVIELTAKAAFRQVASDLFASATDASCKQSSANSAAAAAASPLDSYAVEVRASYRLFQDLCALISGQPCLWLMGEDGLNVSNLKDTEVMLVLEVMEDALSRNLNLFRANPLFTDLITQNLAPSIQEMLNSTAEKSLLKALLGLTVTLLQDFWKELDLYCEYLLLALARSIQTGAARETPGWPCLFAMEALRCAFCKNPQGAELLLGFASMFDLSEHKKPVIANVLNASCAIYDHYSSESFSDIPLGPLLPSTKAFGTLTSDSSVILFSLSAGFFLTTARAAKLAASNGDRESALLLLSQDRSSKVLPRIGSLIEEIPLVPAASTHSDANLSVTVLNHLVASLFNTASASHLSQMPAQFTLSLSCMMQACKVSLENIDVQALSENTIGASRVLCVYDALFRLQKDCGEELGKDWEIVLEALAPLDTKLQECSTKGQSDAETNETKTVSSKLQKRLDEAFASASALSWTACQDLLSALVCSSRATMASFSKSSPEDGASAEGSDSARVFGIARAELVVVSLFGEKRKGRGIMPDRIWQILAGHLVAVCTSSGLKPLRTIALRAMTRISSAALACDTESRIDHQKIINPLADIVLAPFVDTRTGVLESLHFLLQTHGEQLGGSASWETVLAILHRASGSKPAESLSGDKNDTNLEQLPKDSTSAKVTGVDGMVPDGFRVVQLIADDFLSCLSEEVLLRWIKLLRGYGRQREDINVALTSVGLLWRTADFFARMSHLKSIDDLWISLFTELRVVGFDERPEVRNCAVKTLAGTLTTHASKLSAASWQGCIEKALLPLLEKVVHGGDGADGLPDTSPSTSRGKDDMQLLVHHSRDTPRKQWNETRVLALGGVASVLRTAMPLLAALRDLKERPLLLLLADGNSHGLWGKMLNSAGLASTSGDDEVAVAGVSALLDLLHASGSAVSDYCGKAVRRSELSVRHDSSHIEANANAQSTKSLSSSALSASTSWISGILSGSTEDPNSKDVDSGEDPKPSLPFDGAIALWEAVWQAIYDAVCGRESSEKGNFAHAMHRISSNRALIQIARGIGSIQSNLSFNFTAQSSRHLIRVLMFLSSGEEVQKQRRAESTHLSDVEISALEALRALNFEDDVESWAFLLHELLHVLRAYGSSSESSNLVCHVMQICENLFEAESKLPVSIRNQELPALVLILGEIMNKRHWSANASVRSEIAASNQSPLNVPESPLLMSDGTPLWSVAAKALSTVMLCVKDYTTADISFWESYFAVMDDFVYAREVHGPLLGGSGQNRPKIEDTEHHDIRAAECVRNTLAFVSSAITQLMKEKLVGLLGRGAEEGKESKRPRFVRACQGCLFSLADRRWIVSRGGFPQNGISEISAAKVAQVSDRVLAQFIADGKRSGKCPLPASRRAEVVFLLRRLRNLQTFHADGTPEHQGRSSHMMALYPRLGECVDAGDTALRSFSRALIDEAAPIH